MKFPWRKPISQESSIIPEIWGPLWREAMEARSPWSELFPREYGRVRGLSGFLRRLLRLSPKYRGRALPSVYDRKAGETVHVPRISSLRASPVIQYDPAREEWRV